jgi:hypothetical protein
MFVMTLAKGLERTWYSGADVFRETKTESVRQQGTGLNAGFPQDPWRWIIAFS